MPKKSKLKANEIARVCECWLDVGGCYCEPEDNHIRFSTRNLKGEVHGRFENVNDALKYGRSTFPKGKFSIYDELEDREILRYG